MMHRGYTYRLRLTSAQQDLCAQAAGVCRLVWNLALEQRRDHYRRYASTTGHRLNYGAQARELTVLRAEVDFVKAVSQNAQQYALKALDTAYVRFFTGLGGYPQPKRKGEHESFTVAGRYVGVRKINRNWVQIRLPNIGWCKARYSRAHQGTITEVTVSRGALGWQVSLSCKIDAEVIQRPGVLGLDRGVAVPVMDSEGFFYTLPESMAVLEKKARKAQMRVARRQRGSARWRKALKRVAAIRAKQARVRKHWAHTVTTHIAQRAGTVVLEDLRIQQMTKSAKGTQDHPGSMVAQKSGLNRAILNVGWGQLAQMLEYKVREVIYVDPKYTSQICSSCGHVHKDNRESQAVFVCQSCGHQAHADHNAAINIKRRWNTLDVAVAQDAAGYGVNT